MTRFRLILVLDRLGLRRRGRTGYNSGSMSKVCDLCGKGPQFGHKVSHAHNVSNRRWNVNLQSVRAVIAGGNKRIRVCTGCIKNGKVTKAA